MSTQRAGESRRGRFLQLALLGVIVVVVGLYAAAYVFADDRVPHGTRIEGIDVGGLSPAQARQRFKRVMSERTPSVIELRAGGRALRVSPSDVGLRVDAAASIRQVPLGASWNPMHLWDVYKGPRQFDAVVRAKPELRQELHRFAEQFRRSTTRGGIEFEGDTPVPVYPRAGGRLDVAAARTAILDAYASRARLVRVPIERLQPRLTAASVDRAMAEFAEPAVSAPVTFTFGRGSVTLRPSQYAERLSVVLRGGQLVPRVDRSWLEQRLQVALRRTGRAPRDATVRLVSGTPQVVPSRSGLTVVADAAISNFLAMLAAQPGDRTSPLPTEVARPAVTTRTAQGWGIRRVVSSFTTYYPHADYRNVNIGRAAQLVEGTVLGPGELFSLNETVGERTRENGFARGFIISDGIFKQDYGGGVSQVATTVFNAAFFAGLEDVEHQPHSFYIDRYPPGREATVAWPTVDLRFRNDTKFGVLIDTSHTPSTPSSSGVITVRFWSTKVWDIEARTSQRYDFTAPQVRVLGGEDCVPNTGYEGFQIDVTRVFRRAGRQAVDHTEEMHTTYTPSDTVVCQ